MKLCLIRQSGGMGDIIFSQGISNYYSNLGYKVIWPVMRELINEVKYLKSSAEFYNDEDDFPMKQWFLEKFNRNEIVEDSDAMYLPISESSLIVGGKTMQSKYTMCGLDYNIWKDNFIINRNVKKENELYYDVLGLKDGESYCVKNETWCSRPNYTKDLSIYDNYYPCSKIVKMSILSGFSLFDWCKVFENMDSIVTVDTSIMYVFEKLNLKNKTNFLAICRHPSIPHQVGDLFSVPWRYI